MNRKEKRLLSPALSSTEEEREKKARHRFGFNVRKLSWKSLLAGAKRGEPCFGGAENPGELRWNLAHVAKGRD